MQIETHGQQIEVTPALRDYVENRFSGSVGTSSTRARSASSNWDWTSRTTAPRPPSP
jgi:ribosome-associated translation inhibitor RaiA